MGHIESFLLPDGFRLPDDFVNILSIPFGSLLQYMLISGLFGILASILPAFRASRLNVLDAISHN